MATTFDDDREAERSAIIDAHRVNALKKLRERNSTIHACAIATRQAVLGGNGDIEFRGISAADTSRNPTFAEHVRVKYAKFLNDAIEQLLLQGFMVYKIVSADAKTGLLYPLPKTVDCSEEYRYRIDRDDPEQVRVFSPPTAHFYFRKVSRLDEFGTQVVYVEDTRLHPRTVWTPPTDSERTPEQTRTEKGVVTYCAILDSPNGVTGELRSCLNAVYATCAIAESLLRSAIISDRIRSCPPVLTRVKTDAAFDDRELTSLNSVSDVRSVLAFENMALRNEIDAATHRALNDNNKAQYGHAGHAEIDDRLAQTADPMRHSNFVPTVIPLPVDAEVATYSLPAMRSDLAGFQRHAEREIVQVFGLQDDRISPMNIDPFRRDEIRRLLSAVCKNVWRQSPAEFGERFPTTSVDAIRFEFPRTSSPIVDAVAPNRRGPKKRTRYEDGYNHFNY
ncbi:hypothetical protein CYMTET_26600 [Cymbomonas tetramitiformis]|uniref:Uncharacterized protein n=1 Tax=Cymbomonas tetramitiformis TaxID=36881 RepID=A0AAE0KXR1_9CHLO|nr:hypothetical protein CYMTET_26600 [Cymbomonas tetramitiformis]